MKLTSDFPPQPKFIINRALLPLSYMSLRCGA